MAHAGRTLLPPRAWSISARSALVSATVILMALTVAGAILLSVLYFSLISAADNAAASRLRDITKTLQSETPDIDPPLLATDQRIVAVQILDGAGHSVASSSSTPEPPMLALNAIERTPQSDPPVPPCGSMKSGWPRRRSSRRRTLPGARRGRHRG